jgi:hypothetical protein
MCMPLPNFGDHQNHRPSPASLSILTELDKIEIFPISIGIYRNHEPLDVETQATRLVEIFRDFDVYETPWPVEMAERNGGAVDDRLQHWADPPSGSTNSVLYWVGHCWSDGTQVALAHSHSPTAVRVYGILPDKIAEPIRSRQATADGRWAIVIIDTCWSKEFADQVTADLDVDGVLVIGVAGGGAAALGQFPVILDACFKENFRTERDIPLWRLVWELDRRLPEGRVTGRRLASSTLSRRTLPLAGTIAVSLDVLHELEEALHRLPEDERRHFIVKAQGAEEGEVSWFFEGRDAETAQIADWLKGSDEGTLVVTGRAGTGKSALLGHILVQSLPELRDSLIASGFIERGPDVELPPANVFDGVIHLTGVTLDELIRRIAGTAGVGDPPTVAEPTAGYGTANDLEWLIDGLTRQRRRYTFLMDALDEAVDPLAVARSLIRELASVPGVRVLVGTRPSTKESPDHPAPDDQDILDALGFSRVLGAGTGTPRELWISSDREAITRYVTRRLLVARARGLLMLNGQPVSDAAIARAADAVGAEQREFLFAQLAVYEMLADPSLLDQARTGTFARLLAGGHRHLFATAVERLARVSDSFHPLLESLALSRGRGVPIIDGIWALMASSLTGGGIGEVEVTDSDISGLLSEAQPYIALDADAGQTVYRLAHRTFVEYFLSQPES